MGSTRVLVTGGSGFLGSLLSRVLGDSFEVHSLQRTPAPGQENVHLADLRDALAVEALIAKVRPEIVVHTAAQSDVRSAEEDPRGAIEINIHAAMRLAEACCRNGCAQVIALSSAKAAHPQNTYGLSKALMERCLLKLAHLPGCRVISLRLPNLLDSPRSFLADWRRMLAEGGRVVTTGYEMERFACTGSDAARHVGALIAARDSVESGTVAPVSKAVRIKDALLAFTGTHKCAFERRDSGLETATRDIMIAEHEAPWTNRIETGQVPFFHMTPGLRKPGHIDAQVDTGSAEFYSVAELRDLARAAQGSALPMETERE